MTTDKNKFETGDWVKGELKNGELVLGYIETVNQLTGTVKVSVVASDDVKSIGKKIEIFNKVEKIPFSDSKTEGEVRALIDLALQIKDEHWFMELTEKLLKMKIDSYHNTSLKNGHSRIDNRKNVCSSD